MKASSFSILYIAQIMVKIYNVIDYVKVNWNRQQVSMIVYFASYA